MKTTQPMWETLCLPGDTVSAAVELVACEGVERLLSPLTDKIIAIQDQVLRAMGTQGAEAIEFLENLHTETIDLAARLGFGLALTMTLQDYEGWLHAATVKAGLEGYALPECLLGKSEA